jgi:WD40 repeat protein
MSTDETSQGERFLRAVSRRNYAIPIQPAQDFGWNGVPAQYAHGHPKEWGSETESIDLRKDLEPTQDHEFAGFHSALSPDKKLLAVSSPGHERILVYDVSSRSLRQVLEGAGGVHFRPNTSEVRVAKGTSDNALETHVQPVYTLFSEAPDVLSPRRGRASNQLILWELDQNGRLLDEEEPIDPSILATQALEAILPDLIAKHEWTKEFVDASALHTDFAKALGWAAADHRRRHNTIFEDASIGSFNSASFSNDGKLLLYHTQNDTSQQGMREPEDLPQLVIYDLVAGREVHRLSGHTDSIMWSGISPDSQHAATVSWDGTMRMYLVSTGEFLWATENSGGQSWSGAFSPNSEHIVWSSAAGRVIRVHDVASGKEISKTTVKLKTWCRCLAWHPDGLQIALCAENHAYVWLPFTGQDGTVTQHLSLDAENCESMIGLTSIENIFWDCSGRYLCLQVSEDSSLVYDTEYNTKKLFKRPDDQEKTWTDRGFHGIVHNEDGEAFFLSVDGDAKVRYWHTKVDQHPSWWDKPNKEPAAAAPKKPSYPETGRYVKVTKPLATGDYMGSTSQR